ncbi:MAG: STAS domain-containing protein [Phycisphaerales bacterium]|nr:STAS domain-containing protein [Phycisphaerales bacterium]
MAAQFIKFERTGTAVVGLVVPTKVTEREAGVICDEVGAAGQNAGWRVALDLSEVMLLASAGLGALLTINKQCKAGGGALAVFGLSEEILGMIRLTKLDKVLQIRPDRDAALEALG